jgi:hypothetical protein
MFFKSNDKYNHDEKAYQTHWRLVESYRDVDGLVRNRTIVNAGFIDHLSAEKLNAIQKISKKTNQLFDLEDKIML